MTILQQPQVPAQLVAEDRDYFVATWQRTVFTVFRGPPAVEQVGKITPRLQEAARQ